MTEDQEEFLRLTEQLPNLQAAHGILSLEAGECRRQMTNLWYMMTFEEQEEVAEVRSQLILQEVK